MIEIRGFWTSLKEMNNKLAGFRDDGELCSIKSTQMKIVLKTEQVLRR